MGRYPSRCTADICVRGRLLSDVIFANWTVADRALVTSILRTRIGWSKKAGFCLARLGSGISPRSALGGSQRIHPLQMSQSSGWDLSPPRTTAAVL